VKEGKREKKARYGRMSSRNGGESGVEQERREERDDGGGETEEVDGSEKEEGDE
jgi:hypothetical protein